MAYDAVTRDIIGTIGFFLLGVMFGGFAPAFAILREYAQYKQSGVLEHSDVLRYVIVSSFGAVVQAVLLIIIIYYCITNHGR